MQVGQQDVELLDRGPVDCDAERADPGSGVEDERVSTIQSDFDTGGVAAVAERFGAGGGKRSAAAPHPGLHQISPLGVRASQKTVRTPCISSAAPKSG
jgi:hypothetical protein